MSVDICESTPDAGWPLVVTASRKQGAAISTALAANPGMTATINIVDVQPQTDFGLELLSGTSMVSSSSQQG